MTVHSRAASQNRPNTGAGVNTYPHMFSVSVRENSPGHVIIVGKPTRKGAKAFVNVPVTPELHARLVDHMVGSLAMGTAALLEWALDELDSKGVSIEARANG